MAKYSNIKVEGNKETAVVIGPGSVLFNKNEFNQKSKNISSDKQVWEKVMQEMKNLQKEIRNLPDEVEEIRDRELVPLVSQCKGEAEEIQEKPEKEKANFYDNMNKIIDIASKSVLILDKIKPYVNRIFTLIVDSN
ncbi:hypothetical protein [Bacillus sp. FJAT-27251]|uniref:hypothetical protein n=1 Tax=Bacillus sp. FJAT-27251 TaxID=1684142 RepID=UPI0006A7D812|nr:hypothetical protein [Bacillus sp. FJAT-27251]